MKNKQLTDIIMFLNECPEIIDKCKKERMLKHFTIYEISLLKQEQVEKIYNWYKEILKRDFGYVGNI